LSLQSRLPLALLLAAFLAPHATAVRAAVIQVPADQPNLRAAVAVAASGDTVLLWPGVHAGGAFVNGKRLTFASRYLITADTATVTQTILTGDLNGQCDGQPGCSGNSVLEFGNNAAGSAVIGLTLTKGENGVGSASPVDLIHCRVIANNDGVDFTTGAGGTFRSNLFTGNTDDGIDLNGRMNMTIIDNDIRDNADDGIEYRLYSYNGPSVAVNITGNRITGNREDGVQFIDYTGTGAYVLRLEHNLFQANYDAAGLSAAISFMPNSETIETLAGAPSTRRTYVINNTFVGEKNGLVGGANAIVLNNIFTGISGMALSRVSGGSIASYNLFWSCGTNYSQSVIDVPHLLFGNPQLTGSAHLTNASPAINAGTAFFQWQGATVLDLPPTGYADGAPDLGAYESAPNAPPVVSAGPDSTVSLSSDVEDAGTPGAPPLRADAPLAGTVNDDGLPYPPSPSIMWTKVSGPGPVLFQNPIIPDARATFSVPGTYVLQLTVNDGS
jgi:parallel beta-helix repeat protein